MATTKKQTSRRAPSHALFWTLLKEVPGYDPHYKDVIKEGIVHEHSRGRTTSLSEMYAKYPREYSLMIEAMKGTPQQKKTRYDSQENNARRRVIAAISKWVDKLGYSFESREAKVRYVIGTPAAPPTAATSTRSRRAALRRSTTSIASATAWILPAIPELDFPILGN